MLEFKGLQLPVTIREVKKGNIGDIINKPEKRQREDGKWYTPPCLLVQCDEGNMFFVIEDIVNIVIGVSGVRVMFESYAVSFRFQV
jgi:hypothetical protein